MRKEQKLNRRQFIAKSTTLATAATIIPRHVLGGPGHVPGWTVILGHFAPVSKR